MLSIDSEPWGGERSLWFWLGGWWKPIDWGDKGYCTRVGPELVLELDCLLCCGGGGSALGDLSPIAAFGRLRYPECTSVPGSSFGGVS